MLRLKEKTPKCKMFVFVNNLLFIRGVVNYLISVKVTNEAFLGKRCFISEK